MEHWVQFNRLITLLMMTVAAVDTTVVQTLFEMQKPGQGIKGTIGNQFGVISARECSLRLVALNAGGQIQARTAHKFLNIAQIFGKSGKIACSPQPRILRSPRWGKWIWPRIFIQYSG